jgi:hypothetical protein
MTLDGLTTDELGQTVERLRQEAAELRENLEVGLGALRRNREKARRLCEEARQAYNLSKVKEGRPASPDTAVRWRESRGERHDPGCREAGSPR